MSTRTLQERCDRRRFRSAYQVRAELDRLARQVRKLNGLPYGLISLEDYVKRSDVIDLINEAKR